MMGESKYFWLRTDGEVREITSKEFWDMVKFGSKANQRLLAKIYNTGKNIEIAFVRSGTEDSNHWKYMDTREIKFIYELVKKKEAEE